MLLFYGLGNNADKYFQTKHNCGRLLLESLVKSLSINFQKQESCYLAKKSLFSSEIWFIYSAGFMNESGLPLVNLVKYYKLNENNNLQLILLQDDSDQFEGLQKLSLGGSSAGHRGINSIYGHLEAINLKQTDIWRLKIGIRPPENKLRSETFVLKSISAMESQHYQKLAKLCYQNLNLFTEDNFSRLQNIFNSVL